MNTDLKPNGAALLSFIKDVIIRAGDFCLSQQEKLTLKDVTFKNPKDLVTKIDTETEMRIIEDISSRFPDHGILGEETGQKSAGHEFLWVIDPIDGTTSFFHGQPFFSVSIALQENGTTVLGAVYAPALNQLFYAQKGQGAFLNNRPIRVSATDSLVQAVMGTGFACLRAGRKDNNLPILNHLLPQLRDIRRYGSAALDLCYVAWGRLDGFWELELNLYDIAAGVLVVEEAGGVVTDFGGDKNFPEEGIASANPLLHPLLLNAFKSVSP